VARDVQEVRCSSRLGSPRWAGSTIVVPQRCGCRQESDYRKVLEFLEAALPDRASVSAIRIFVCVPGGSGF